MHDAMHASPEQVGWPWTMPSKEKGRFLQQLHATKRDELRNMVDDAQLPLRQGVCSASVWR